MVYTPVLFIICEMVDVANNVPIALNIIWWTKIIEN